jgi:hypothetical protein
VGRSFVELITSIALMIAARPCIAPCGAGSQTEAERAALSAPWRPEKEIEKEVIGATKDEGVA